MKKIRPLKNTGTTIITYTILFCILMAGIFAMFILQGRSFVNHADAYDQGYFWTVEMKHNLDSLFAGNGYPLWSWDRGTGIDTKMPIDPFLVIASLFPAGYVELGYTVAIILRLYFAGVMIVGSRGHDQAELLGIMVGIGVMHRTVAGIGNFCAVCKTQAEADIGHVIAHAERVGLNDGTAAFVYQSELAGTAAFFNLGMVQQPLLIKTIDKVFIVTVSLFPAKENIQPDFLPFLPGILKACAEKPDFFIPGKMTRNCTVPSEKVICYNNPGKTEIPISAHMLFSGRLAACAGKTGMHVCFI